MIGVCVWVSVLCIDALLPLLPHAAPNYCTDKRTRTCSRLSNQLPLSVTHPHRLLLLPYCEDTHPARQVDVPLLRNELQHTAVRVAPRGPVGHLEQHRVLNLQRGCWMCVLEVVGRVRWLVGQVRGGVHASALTVHTPLLIVGVLHTYPMLRADC